ncbi:TadE/TadG family type IV pilus assembly protein [Aestuariimicrobium sp. Y1814]|uniref:TadE/TadG family type IV pilus assembly protein n=1 Tax=Aestuariimicrobium sp. Y1814 TaxID=3418742 RepID=UPI003DA73F34
MSRRARSFAARRRPHRERGLSQSVQWALLTPLVVLLIVGVVQAAAVLQARQVANSAALAGAEAEAWYQAPVGSGGEVARRSATGSGLRNVTVTSRRSGGMATVTVSGSADLFLDFGQGRVTSTAVMPLEEP